MEENREQETVLDVEEGVRALLSEDEEETTAVPESSEEPAKPLGGSDDARARMQADIREFLREFPDVKPSDIGEEVWREVRNGRTLVSAFRGQREQRLAEENRQLRNQLEINSRNERNRQRSTGTQRTSGRDSGRDAFLEALLGGDA